MANNRSNAGNTGKVSGKIRFIMLEADITDGNLSEITQAITGAVRPISAPSPRYIEIAPAPATVEGKSTVNGLSNGQTSIDPSDNSDEADIRVTPAVVAPERPSRDRKPFKGEIDDTILWDGGGTPFVDYVKQKSPQDTTKKYLVITAWFKRHGVRETINANLMYNAYRKMGWTALVDMNQPLREGAKSRRGYYKSDAKSGAGFYTITNIGLDMADKVGGDKKDGGS